MSNHETIDWSVLSGPRVSRRTLLQVAAASGAVAEGKRYNGRSGVHPLTVAARTAQADADRLLWHRLRHVRSGSLNNSLG